MARTNSIDKPIKVTEHDLRYFERFGCALRERPGILLIDWRGKSPEMASKADIFAALGGLKGKAGPLIVLALEISPVRPLPQYCYFPFDVARDDHQKVLSGLTQTGEIKLCFIAGRMAIKRTHQLGPMLKSRATEVYAESLRDLEHFGRAEYRFESALAHMERWVRIPEFLEHSLSEKDVHQLRADIEEAARRVPSEQRELAHRIVRGAVDAFKTKYQENRTFLLERGRLTRRGLLYVTDLDRLTADNGSIGATELLADGIAAAFSQNDLENLDEWLKVVLSLPAISRFFKSQSGPIASAYKAFLPRLPKGLGDAIKLLATKRGISPNSLRNLVELLGGVVEGKAGRPPKDYSREYELRMTPMSWPDVARVMVSESAELRAEFNGTDYDHLDAVHQEQVWNRIRQGVTAHARKIGKPVPTDGDEPDVTKG